MSFISSALTKINQSSVVESVKNILNTPQKQLIAIVALTALVALGAVLIAVCAKRYWVNRNTTHHTSGANIPPPPGGVPPPPPPPPGGLPPPPAPSRGNGAAAGPFVLPTNPQAQLRRTAPPSGQPSETPPAGQPSTTSPAVPPRRPLGGPLGGPGQQQTIVIPTNARDQLRSAPKPVQSATDTTPVVPDDNDKLSVMERARRFGAVRTNAGQ